MNIKLRSNIWQQCVQKLCDRETFMLRLTPTLVKYRYQGNCGSFRPAPFILRCAIYSLLQQGEFLIGRLLTIHSVRLIFTPVDKWLKREVLGEDKALTSLNVQSGPPCDKPNSSGQSGEESRTKERMAVSTQNPTQMPVDFFTPK